MNAHAADPCSAFNASLQDLLDGHIEQLPAEDDLHRLNCLACDADFRAARAILRLAPVPAIVPPEFTDRLVALVLADGKSPAAPPRLSRLIALFAVAAALLLALSLGSRRSTSGSGGVSPPELSPPVPAAHRISVDEQLSEAGNALASLTRRAVEPTKLLIPPRSQTTGLKVPVPPATPLAPAAQGLVEIRQGAAAGLEPMATSARRALAMFVRELPDKPDRKPDF